MKKNLLIAIIAFGVVCVGCSGGGEAEAPPKSTTTAQSNQPLPTDDMSAKPEQRTLGGRH